MDMTRIQATLDSEPELELAVLVGSRCQGTATDTSDWDIAIQWVRDLGFEQSLVATERLREKLAHAVGRTADDIDLIDLPTARLAMRALVAEEGCLLRGDGSLAWSHFLLRTWRELEQWAWEAAHAA
jgi:predicted nucleotidyltransferase